MILARASSAGCGNSILRSSRQTSVGGVVSYVEPHYFLHVSADEAVTHVTVFRRVDQSRTVKNVFEQSRCHTSSNPVLKPLKVFLFSEASSFGTVHFTITITHVCSKMPIISFYSPNPKILQKMVTQHQETKVF